MKRRMVLLGPPGSGKGTHAELLLERFGLATLSTGAQLRREMALGTELGRRAHELTRGGNFVPDAVVLELAGKWLQEHQAGFVLDGFPRTLGQAEALDELLASLGAPLEIAIALEVPVEELRQRIVRRVICVSCQHTDQVAPPISLGTEPEALAPCPRCGGKMQRRADDSLETLEIRLREYQSKTQPLIPYYEAQGILCRIDASREIEHVFSDVQRAL